MSGKHIVSLEVKLYAFSSIVRVSIQPNSVYLTSQERPQYPLDKRYGELHAILDRVQRAKLPVPMTGTESQPASLCNFTHTHTHTYDQYHLKYCPMMWISNMIVSISYRVPSFTNVV
jgi:hypothetical protein